MRIPHPAIALLAALALPAAASAAAAPGWTFGAGAGEAALVFGTPGTDRDAFRLDCSGGKMTISTWAPSPPRNVTQGSFPTQISVFFGKRELIFAATGSVAASGDGAGRLTRVDARIPEPGAFLTSLDGVSRLTTVIYAGRRMAVTPSAAQTAEFRKACGF
jgi:hypothetical protein